VRFKRANLHNRIHVPFERSKRSRSGYTSTVTPANGTAQILGYIITSRCKSIDAIIFDGMAVNSDGDEGGEPEQHSESIEGYHNERMCDLFGDSGNNGEEDKDEDGPEGDEELE
jgi:hypothetical protein